MAWPINLSDLDGRLISQLKKLVKEQVPVLEITSTYPLAEEEITKIKKKLGITDPEIITENKVDPSILGGLIIKFGNDGYYDSSVRGKITIIAEKLNI